MPEAGERSLGPANVSKECSGSDLSRTPSRDRVNSGAQSTHSGKSPTRWAIRHPNRSAGSALTRWPAILTSLVAVRDPVRGANGWSVRIDGNR